MKPWLLLILLFSFSAHAAEPVPHFSRAEFEQLANELAPKVNLFAEAWAQDPQAEFYGGTTRDYLFWLKGKFKDSKSAEESKKIAAGLKKLSVIDVRDFIVGDSDVDIISKGVELRPQEFGVKKIDSRGADLFDAATEAGKNELLQGHIPTEKIRLAKSGFVKPGNFGDGLGELHAGKLTVHFARPEDFAQSHYAKQKLNHEVLLALRYLRLAAINYFNSYGSGFPVHARLLDMDPAIQKKIKQVIHDAITKRELTEHVAKPQFLGWLNGSIQKGLPLLHQPHRDDGAGEGVRSRRVGGRLPRH